MQDYCIKTVLDSALVFLINCKHCVWNIHHVQTSKQVISGLSSSESMNRVGDVQSEHVPLQLSA